MDSKNQRLIPYPKRLHTLIQSYQAQKNAKDLERIIALIDKLLIKVVRYIYRTKDFEYLQYYEADELYDTAIIALEKAISKIKVDEDFTINKLSSYLSGYVSREFKIWFQTKEKYVDIESTDEKNEVIFSHNHEQDRNIRDIDLVVPGFSEEVIMILQKHLRDKMSLQEIADEMNVKKGYVRYWVDKGKKTLKKVLEKERNNLWAS